MAVPAHILSKTWREANFIIPADSELRNALLKELEGYFHTGIMSMPGNEQTRLVLQARIAALNAHDFVHECSPKTKAA